jgi:hypothetical protein
MALIKEGFSTLPSSAVESFSELKKALSSYPVLRSPKYDREFYLETDASKVSYGAILSQKDDKGDLHPVAYGSRKLQEREKRYSASELEMGAVIYGLTKFKTYLLLMKVVIITDHSALSHLQRLVSQNAKLARWQLILESYDHTIVHRAGKKSSNVDCLSRVEIED